MKIGLDDFFVQLPAFKRETFAGCKQYALDDPSQVGVYAQFRRTAPGMSPQIGQCLAHSSEMPANHFRIRTASCHFGRASLAWRAASIFAICGR